MADPLERAPADPAHEALAASIPEAWVEAARARYSMHGHGLIRNILAGVAPLIEAIERDRADAAEAKLAKIRSVLLEGGQDDATARRRAIAITGTGRDRADASEAKMAEVRSTVTAFLGHYGNSTAASFQQALDLAHGVLQVLDRVPLEAQERGGGEGAGQ